MKFTNYSLLILLIIVISCRKQQEPEYITDKQDYRIAILDFMSHNVFAESISEYFTPYDLNLNFQVFNNLGSLQDALKNDKKFDLIMGLKNTDVYFFESDSLFVIYDEKIKMKSEYKEMYKMGITPLFYNFLSFTYSENLIKNPPQTFGQLTDNIHDQQFLVFSPESTDLGRDFLLFTIALWKTNGFRHFWSGFKQNVIMASNDIESGVDRFLAKEALYCLSYSTFPYYMNKHENEKKLNSISFQEGGFKVVFGAAIPKESKFRSISETFVKYIYSAEFQKEIPLLLAMYPVVSAEELSDELKLPKKPTLVYDKELRYMNICHNYANWLKIWKKEILTNK
ncbi:MAG: ABC transporter substrate-binding protein [Candidatus Cloacimonetes bacterium]|nr:ABC transporter substrate-binding protein [Candidatus Cloacimonadota bacterium]